MSNNRSAPLFTAIQVTSPVLAWQRGMAFSLDTLCGQAFGAEQHHLLGVYKQRAMLVLTLVSIPVSVIWAHTGEILVLFRQDPEIAAGAGNYIRFMTPALFLYGLLECHARFLQTQNVVVPVMLSCAATAVVHVAACWLLVFKLGMGANGAALGNAVSYLGRILQGRVPRHPWLLEARRAVRPHALVRTLHNCILFRFECVIDDKFCCSNDWCSIEWWAFELLVLLSGLLPNPKLETAVQSICFNIYTFAYMIPLGLSYAASIRVSNELGAGRPQAARLATRVVILLAFSLGVSEGLVMVLVRNVLGYVYSNEKEVALYTAKMMPILAASTLFDSIQSVLSGVVRGCGQQKIGAIINLAAYYFAGIPAACVFAFVFHLKGMGLWFGILCGLVVQVMLLLSITLFTNWNKEVSIEALKANDRVSSSSQPVELTTSGCTKEANGCRSVGKDTQGTNGAKKVSIDPEEKPDGNVI
ncbi:hypothetical protein PR202_ga07222 [Eleusine coracana subsp. coracana]|uniref:Protein DETOXIFICATION n=1 Tax=Eleusine coracana subsp. coracana TaxID=191504 RepID=A0AAV5BWX0_ELECO|nr:hypothetical protein PR202_ga07222 [Eleusine coracana subsp. coracana]